jgi:hypothetical protein
MQKKYTMNLLKESFYRAWKIYAVLANAAFDITVFTFIKIRERFTVSKNEINRMRLLSI